MLQAAARLGHPAAQLREGPGTTLFGSSHVRTGFAIGPILLPIAVVSTLPEPME
jgi:hypothetical protein